MKQLSRYIAVTAIGASLVAVLVIVSLELVFAFIEESGDIGEGDYTAATALMYVLLIAPQRAYEAFPMATLIGSLMGLGGLAARNELTAMRAAGYSVLEVARAVMVAGLLLGLIAVALGEWAAPPAARYAQHLQVTAQTGQAPTPRGGFWAREGGRFVEVERALSDTRLRGVRIYEFEDQRLLRLISAQAASHDAEGWRLSGVQITHFGADGIAREDLAETVWHAELRPQVLETVVVGPETLSMSALNEYIGYLTRNGLESDRYRLALWVKIATPVATMALLLLTVPLVFGSARSAGAGQRIFLGVLIGIAFFLFNRLLNQLGLVYGLSPALSALLPSGLFALIGLWGLSRVR